MKRLLLKLTSRSIMKQTSFRFLLKFLCLLFYVFQEDLNQAIQMISYYASSSEPAQVRGKTVYLQYSNRQEIVNNKTTADVVGNVLLVTIEGEDARMVSIDVLHLVSGSCTFLYFFFPVFVRRSKHIAGEMFPRHSDKLGL